MAYKGDASQGSRGNDELRMTNGGRGWELEEVVWIGKLNVGNDYWEETGLWSNHYLA
jgi:hypothetical protein